MEFKCSVKDLHNAVSSISRVLNKKTTMEILSNIFIKTEGSTIVLRCTDLGSSTDSVIEAEVISEGEALIKGQDLLEVLGVLNSDVMTFSYSLETRSVVITCNKAKFLLISKEEAVPSSFPMLDEMNKERYVTVAPTDLKKAIGCTRFATDSKDSKKMFLTGIHAFTEGMMLKLVATDNHRLSVYSIPVIEKNDDVDIIIPAYCADMIKEMLDETKPSFNLYFSKGSVYIKSGNAEYNGRLIDDKYPDVNRVIPEDCKTVITVNRAALFSALAKMEVASKNNSYICYLKTEDGELVLFSQSFDGSMKASEYVPAEMEGGPVELGINVRYAKEALSVMDAENVEIKINSETRPFVVKECKNENFIHILMPLALTSKDKQGIDNDKHGVE